MNHRAEFACQDRSPAHGRRSVYAVVALVVVSAFTPRPTAEQLAKVAD
ncbi:MAG: hypothetical protein WB341_02280 [Terracidiphilus sp.]